MRNSISFIILFCGIILSLSSCAPDTSSQSDIKWRNINIPDTDAGAQGNLYLSDQGNLYYSWIHHVNDSLEKLKIAIISDGKLIDLNTVSEGDDWFVNWADFPAVSAYNRGNGELITHWLAKSAEGVYDYDITISILKSDTWQDPFVLHDDHVPAEHGFVSYLPLDNGQMLVAWLDGRNTKDYEGNYRKDAEMSLRSAILDTDGKKSAEFKMDARTCECCQIDMAMSAIGPVLVYRDRSNNEVRDIYYSIMMDTGWLQPRPIFNDNWYFPSCPVNGPAIASIGKSVLVTWLTGAADTAKIKLAFSTDGGLTFNDPLQLDENTPLGRLDVKAFDHSSYLLSWMGKAADGLVDLNLSLVTPEKGIEATIKIASVDASRSSGFPRMAIDDTNIYLTWTEVGQDLKPRLVQIEKEALLL